MYLKTPYFAKKKKIKDFPSALRTIKEVFLEAEPHGGPTGPNVYMPLP